MAFNHYAKIKRILADYPQWYIVKIDKPTTTKGFNGETFHYPHYYRIYSDNQPLKYCKFQRLSLLAKTLNIDEFELELKVRQ